MANPYQPYSGAGAPPPYPQGAQQQHYGQPPQYPPQPQASPMNYQQPPPPPPQQQQQQYGQPQYGQPQYTQPNYNRPAPPLPGQQPLQQQPYGQQYNQTPSQPYGQAYGQPQLQNAPPPPSGYQPYSNNQSGFGYGKQQHGQGQQYPPPPGGQPQYGQQQYPPQPGQQQYPPPGQQQYGGQQGYGAPAPGGGPQDVASYKQLLSRQVEEKKLQQFFPPNSPVLDQVAQRAATQVDRLCQQWRIPAEVGRDLSKLGLYDIILYVDDSGSMQFEENGERIEDLKLVLSRVVTAATSFDEDGISVRFMNTALPQGVGDNVRDQSGIDNIMRNVKFSGLTPMGRELRKKVIDDVVLRNARGGHMPKPFLVIAISDGQPAGDEPNNNAVFDAIRYADNELRNIFHIQGRKDIPVPISFQFAQVGNDQKAREFLGKLDSDPGVGSLVDCTSNFETEQAEMANLQPPVELTPDLWMIKLLLGAIDSSYDSKDEVRSYRPGGAGAPPPQQQYGGPPPGQYGAPQQQQYGAPPGQQGYGAPPPGQHGGYGAPPPGQQGGYGAPPGGHGAPPGGQQGYPPQGYPPQQGGYPPQQPQQGGYPPQQGYGGGYPPQQGGGYGQPPPPPRY